LDKNMLGTGTWWADDLFTLSPHNTTHFDAPWHYGRVSEGKPAKTIDQIPLEWCYGDGVVIDVRHRGNMEDITEDDIKNSLKKINYKLKPLDIVLIMTGNHKKYAGTPDYFGKGSGMSAAATEYIVKQGVKVIGIDSFGFDKPLFEYYKLSKETGKQYWEAHLVGIKHEYCHIERMANFEALPPYGFKVACFPIAVDGATAGPCRAVAILED